MAAKGRVKKNGGFNAETWLRDNFERLVDKFPGQFVVVADGNIYHGHRPRILRELAHRDHPEAMLLGLRIPRPRDFVCALFLSTR